MPNAEEKNHAYMDALFSVREADIPDPQSGDTILYRGKTYEFFAIQEYSLGIFHLRFIYGRSAVDFP